MSRFPDGLNNPKNWIIKTIPVEVKQVMYKVTGVYPAIQWYPYYYIDEKGQARDCDKNFNRFPHPGYRAQDPQNWEFDESERPIIIVRGVTRKGRDHSRTFYVVKSTSKFFRYGIQETPTTPDEVSAVIALRDEEQKPMTN